MNTTTSFNNDLGLQRCLPMGRAEELNCATEYAKTKTALLAEPLITANMRLVVTIARGYRRPGCDLRDLVQEGNLGLMHAVAHYDASRGVKLCSYAAWWIRAYILRFLLNNWRLVKAGTTQAQRRLFFNLQKEKNKLERNGEEADVKQLALVLDVEEREVVTMLERFAGTEKSLESPVSSGTADSRTLADSLSADAEQQPDLRVENHDFSQALRSSLKMFEGTLRGRELDIFQRRLLSDEPATLQQLAVIFGVTRERTRQLERRLKGRIRDHLRQELGDAVEPSSFAN